MEPSEILAAIEATAEKHDALVKDLVASLMEHKAATADIVRINLHHMRAREERTSMIVEAAFSAKDIDDARARVKLYEMLGMPT